MNILTITGAHGAGKTTCLNAMSGKLGGVTVRVMTGGISKAREDITNARHERVYIDFERRPSPALLKFVFENTLRNRVRHLVIAHT